MTAIVSLLVLILISIGLGTAVVAGIRRSARPGGSGPSEDDGGGGGSDRRRPLMPHGPLSPTEPPWWPRFEREFAEYVAACGRSQLPATFGAAPRGASPASDSTRAGDLPGC